MLVMATRRKIKIHSKSAGYSLDTLIDNAKNFIVALPPLLQLLAGIFATIGFLRLFMFVVDFIEDRRERKS